MTTFEQRLRDSLSHAYEIERELGGGGMSRVFVATDRSLGRKVVIKLLSPELTAEVNRGRFRREIQVAAQLQHPHIVTLLSAGEDGELVYYTMPFIHGESLKSALDKKGPLSVRDVVRVLYDVVDALAYAHEQGVVHRDIKPANILRSGSHSLVTDFGVAKALNAAMPSSAMTSTGMAIGTPAYMAPEQLAGDPSADHRIDIYAVGLLAYELLSGKSPFVAASPQAVLAAVLTRDPKPVSEIRDDVPPRLSDMIMQCLSKVPGGRPPSAEALMVALDMFSTASGEIRTREHAVHVLDEAEKQTPNAPAIAFVAPLIAPAVIASPIQTPVPEPPQPTPVTVPTVPTAIPADTVVPAEKKGRSRMLVGALALLLLAGTGGVLLSQRFKRARPPAAADAPSVALAPELGTDSVATNVASVPTVVAPPVMTRADSMAIAESVRQRLAQAVAAEKKGGIAVDAEAVRRQVQREIADSISRANQRATAAAAAAVAAAPVVPVTAPAAAPPPPPTGKRRLAITEPRQFGDRPALRAFSAALTGALRASLDNGEAFGLVDQDSVTDVIGRTTSRDEAARVLRPDVMVSPSYVGAGDTVNVVVTVWDLRSNSSFGIRVSSSRLVPSNPEHYLGPIVQSVLKQLDDLARMPTIYRR